MAISSEQSKTAEWIANAVAVAAAIDLLDDDIAGYAAQQRLNFRESFSGAMAEIKKFCAENYAATAENQSK